MRSLTKIICFLTLLLAFSQGSFARVDASSIDASIEGLASETYEPMAAERFLKTKVVWINKKYFASHGVDLSDPKKLAAFGDSLNERYGFLIPGPTTPMQFFDHSNRLTIYPDGYGGPGLNGNYGSGRAATTVDHVQIKGPGPTNQVGDNADLDHISGGVGATQAIAEAVWSVLLNEEAPYGSNQVIALIDTGLMEPLVNGISQPRYLVIREDPIRPAHFIPNTNAMSAERRIKDQARVKANIGRLRSLMLQYHQGNPTDSLGKLFVEFATKTATQWAYLHANYIHHGAVTPSNIELSGKLLDLSSVSTLPGAMQAMAYDLLPFGDPRVIDLYLLKPFYDAIVDAGETLDVSYEEAREAYYLTYKNRYQIEILKLTGVSERMAEEVAGYSESQKVLTLIETLRLTGHDQQIKTKAMVPEEKGSYDVFATLTELGRLQENSKDNSALMAAIPDQALRSNVIGAFAAYYSKVNEIFNLTPTDKETIANESAARNRDRRELRRNLKTYLQKAAYSTLQRWNLASLQNWIDTAIETSSIRSSNRSRTSSKLNCGWLLLSHK